MAFKVCKEPIRYTRLAFKAQAWDCKGSKHNWPVPPKACRVLGLASRALRQGSRVSTVSWPVPLRVCKAHRSGCPLRIEQSPQGNLRNKEHRLGWPVRLKQCRALRLVCLVWIAPWLRGSLDWQVAHRISKDFRPLCKALGWGSKVLVRPSTLDSLACKAQVLGCKGPHRVFRALRQVCKVSPERRLATV